MSHSYLFYLPSIFISPQTRSGSASHLPPSVSNPESGYGIWDPLAARRRAMGIASVSGGQFSSHFTWLCVAAILRVIISAGADRAASSRRHHFHKQAVTDKKFFLFTTLIYTSPDMNPLGTGFAIDMVSKGKESSEERNSNYGNLGSSWH